MYVASYRHPVFIGGCPNQITHDSLTQPDYTQITHTLLALDVLAKTKEGKRKMKAIKRIRNISLLKMDLIDSPNFPDFPDFPF